MKPLTGSSALNDILTYAQTRKRIRTGDTAVFYALPFRSVFRAPWNRKLATFGGWLSNWGIVLKQKGGNVDSDGLEHGIHVGTLVSYKTGTDLEIMLYEFISGMDGLQPVRFSERCAAYWKLGGKVSVLPLTKATRRRLRTGKAHNGTLKLLESLRKAKYSYSKLPLAALQIGVLGLLWRFLRNVVGVVASWFGIKFRHRMFCSEAVVYILMKLGAWPYGSRRKVWRNSFILGDGWAWVRRRPEDYCPSEVGRLSIVDIDKAYEVVA